MNKIFENKISTVIEPKKLGLVERRLRLNSNLTIEQAAKYLGISRGNLSEIENGKRGLKEEAFLKFINHFYPDFNFDWLLVEEAEKKLDELAFAFIYCNFAREDEIEKWVEKNRVSLLNSFACLYLTVFETYFYYRKSIDRDEEDQLNGSDGFIQYFSPDVKAFLLFNKGYMYMDTEKSNEAIELFEMALREMDCKKWPQLEGVIKLNLACVVAQDLSFQRALDLVSEAVALFIKDANFFRVVIAYNNQANYLCLIGQYEKAIYIVDKVILNKNTFQDQRAYTMAVSNKILIEMLWGHFTKALQFVQNHKFEFNPKHPDNFVLEPYCLLRLGCHRECIKSIKSYQNYTLGEEDEAFYALIKAVISKKEDRIDKTRVKMLSVCHRTKNWGMALMTFHVLIYYYKQTGQSDRLVEVYEWQAGLHNHQMPDICEL